MNHRSVWSLNGLLILMVSLAGCSSSAEAPTVASGADSTDVPRAGSEITLARTDSQGAVEFVVTPLNLDVPAEILEFEVVMDTHSVDLAWDLAAQSTLRTDTGLVVQGLAWPVGSGHHYQGTLTFSATTADGKPLLDGTRTLTMTIRDTDVAERVFVWERAP